MDLPVIRYVKGTYVETPTGNKVAKPDPGQDSKICGTQNIVLNGKVIIFVVSFLLLIDDFLSSIRCKSFSSNYMIFLKHWSTFKHVTFQCIIHKEVAMRGDMANIRCGRFCIIGSRTTIRPGNKKFSKGVTLMPVHIGDHVYIEENCVIAAAQVGGLIKFQ